MGKSRGRKLMRKPPKRIITSIANSVGILNSEKFQFQYSWRSQLGVLSPSPSDENLTIVSLMMKSFSTGTLERFQLLWNMLPMLTFGRILNYETHQPCGFWRCRSSRHDIVIAWARKRISNTIRNRLYQFLPVDFRDNWLFWILEGAMPSSPFFDAAALPD